MGHDQNHTHYNEKLNENMKIQNSKLYTYDMIEQETLLNKHNQVSHTMRRQISMLVNGHSSIEMTKQR